MLTSSPTSAWDPPGSVRGKGSGGLEAGLWWATLRVRRGKKEREKVGLARLASFHLFLTKPFFLLLFSFFFKTANNTTFKQKPQMGSN